ncbi:sporulation protein, YlmC/YmxH family [Thermoactinomyces sp. DSM 45891]|uniref:YlmC/YmxH family sporulation protein n=1 Tax=unclassified Thermoactinomyces TaxID=2634588 RepID=UPI000899C86A|nr:MULTISPECIES: YlmC/YmxH family sporulation protein [unclassified Thermoactinomyces]SDY47849.1 sporulation protein, YlmC/YmxH family [Thermoactinomyces sp. DSM 45892]SFX34894.1 sporulation protein, YlmC/YmxH family [Thermoactinomyces sp. DSM 45891]
MRWSEMANKECIDLTSGERLGSFSHADLVIDPNSGQIESILIPMGGTSVFKKRSHEVRVAWGMIRKVGPEMVIIDSGRRS